MTCKHPTNELLKVTLPLKRLEGPRVINRIEGYIKGHKDCVGQVKKVV